MSVFRYVPVGPGALVALAAGAGVVVAVALLTAPRERRRSVKQLLLRLALVGYAAGLLVITLSGGSTRGVNLAPLAGIRAQLTNVNRELGIVNIVGNVLIFVPVPLLARATWVPSWPLAFASGAGLSLAIEVTQLFAGRSADIDDVLLNSAGALLGAAAGWAAVTLAARLRAQRPAQVVAASATMAPPGART